jgi:uncharacterized protein (DUF2384 family)
MTAAISSDEITRISKQARIHQAYIDVFSSESGKIVLAHMEKECGMFEVRKTLDPNVLLFDQGGQYWYKLIKHYLETSPQEAGRTMPLTAE